MPQQFRPGDAVLVLFQRDAYNQVNDIEIPEGTRLIGTWDNEQPADEQTYAITVQWVAWKFAKDSVTLHPLGEQVNQWKEQERLAQASLAEAQAHERQGDLDAAVKLYARALIELAAAGKTESELTRERFNRAFLLQKANRIDEAIVELDRVARTHEALVDASIYGKSLDDAETAASALIAQVTFLLQGKGRFLGQEQQRLRKLVDRLLVVNKLIKKRYETKIYLLYTAAEALLHLEERADALALFDQGERFYQQQLAPMEDLGLSNIEAITSHRKHIKAIIGTISRERTVRCQMTAETADQLQIILDTFQQQVRGFRVTKGVTAVRPDNDTRKGMRYTANVSLTISSQEQ